MNINKKLLLIIGFLSPSALIIVMIVGGLFIPEQPIHRSTNNEIINVATSFIYQDSSFFNQVTNLFFDTNYEGNLFYNFQNSGGRHTLWTDNKDLTDSFPKIREVITQKFPDARKTKYYIWYINKVVFILPKRALFNQDEHSIVLLFAKNKEQILNLYPTYRVYDKGIPQESSCWLFNYNDYCYICSPNHLVYYSL